MNIKLAVSLIIIGVCIVVVGAGYYLHVNNLNIVLLSPLATSSPVQIIGQAQETPQPQPVAVITSLPDEEHLPVNESYAHCLNGTCDSDHFSYGNYDDGTQYYSGYAKDLRAAYYHGQKIAGADYTSFIILRGTLGISKGDGPFLAYAKDAYNIYYQGAIVPGAVPAAFHLLENGAFYQSYGTDGMRVYFHAERISGADVSTFKILWKTPYEGCASGAHYSADKAHVYYESQLVVGADPATFEGLYNGYMKDRSGYYKGAAFVGPTVDPKLLDCGYG